MRNRRCNRTSRMVIIDGFTIYWKAMDPRVTVLQQAAFDNVLDSLKHSSKISNLQSMRIDSSVVYFEHTEDGKTSKFMLYKRWTPASEMLTMHGGTHILIDCLGSLNQYPTVSGHLPELKYSIFGYGKIQNWQKASILL